jgi:PAS domain S-box-containing protein
MQRLKRRWQSQVFQQEAMLGIGLVALIVALFLVDLRQRYVAAIDQGKKSAQNFAEILSEHTALTFENVERMLREAAKIRKDSLEGDYASLEDVNAALRLLAKTSPAIVAVGWTDVAGKVVAHSYDGAPPRTDVSQMAHFAVHRDNAGDSIYVSSPFRSAASNKWLTAASLRLSNNDGTFAGIMTTPLDQSYFAKIYRSIDLGKEGSILLLHRDGLLLAREPALESAMGRSFASMPLLAQHLPKSDKGSFESLSAVDGMPRVAGYKAVRGLPLVVLVSYGRGVVLQSWYRHLLILGPLVGFVAAAILFGTFLIVRQTRNLAHKSEEIERTNTRFDRALSEMPNGLVMWSADQRIVIANSRFREMYGLKPEQVAPGTTLGQILEAHMANGERTELSIDEYVKIVSAQAEQIHVLADGRTIAMRRQRMPDGGWIATHQDITEHKRAETLLRATLDNMDQGLIAVGRDGRITLMNARVLDLLDLPHEFATRRPHKSEVVEYQRSIGEFPSDEAYTEVVIDTKEPRHAISERKRPNGTVLEIRTVPTEEGGYVRTYSDVTARRTAEAALRQERDRAEAAARATAEFLANMSHELRTPLTAIIGVSDMLLSGTESPERQRNFMEMQRAAGKGLLGVISNVLDFSKIEAGQLSLEKAPLSLKDLTDGCIKLVLEQAQRKGVELTSSIAQDVHDRVLGDDVRLRQVLLNLVGNAVKFTPSGSVRLDVDSDPAKSDSIRFAVSDTGIGISPRDMPALFQRFVQADRSTTRRYTGSGLGLAISRELVALMGGTIEVQSELGRGSVFSFTIKMSSAGQGRSEDTAPNPNIGISCRVLLAEDNSLNRELIKAMLQQAGHEVVTVNDGAEAVRVAIRNSFDAVLMDVQMPEMDGYAAAQAIRAATAERPRLPIIALTANALPGESNRCLEAGMNVHVPKPVDWPMLLAIIERLVVSERQGETALPWTAKGSAGELDTGARSAIFDETVVAHLRKTIGEENSAKLLRLFLADARERFQTEPDAPAAREVIRREAHTVGGSAGLLGFLELAEACRALEAAPANDAFDRALDRCRRERDAALRTLIELMPDETPAKEQQASA